MKMPCVYMLCNVPQGTLYVGVTSDLAGRVFTHRQGKVAGFTARYGVDRLVWFERHETMEAAISREKQLKAGSRARKVALIEALNPEWRDLYNAVLGGEAL